MSSFSPSQKNHSMFETWFSINYSVIVRFLLFSSLKWVWSLCLWCHLDKRIYWMSSWICSSSIFVLTIFINRDWKYRRFPKPFLPPFLHRLLTVPSFVRYLVTSIQQREDSKIFHHEPLTDEEVRYPLNCLSG